MNRSIKKISGFSFFYLIIFSFFLSQSALGETQFTIEGDLNSLLYKAVKDGKSLLAIETLLIESGADVNAKNDQGYTALHAAARYSTAAVVKALLKAGADVNAKNHQGYTPLYEVAHNAKEKDAQEIARVLLEAGETGEIMNVRSYYGSTPFHWAARYGTLAFVKTLIESGVDVSAKDLKGYTPLHLAAEGNTEAVVEAILKANASVNAKADNGQIPLHLAAASSSRAGVLKMLLEAGANTNGKDKNDRTPLHLAAASNTNIEVLKILFAASKTSRDAKDIEGYTPFYRAAANNTSAAVIEFFILNGENAKASIKDGWTTLHVAARHNKEPDIMRTLIRAGSVNATDQEGWTALHIAARYNNVSVVETLIQNGADVNVRGNFVGISKEEWGGGTRYPLGTQGLTPLHWAAENDTTTTAPDIVKALIEAGADVNAATKEDRGEPWTPLTLAVCYNAKTVLSVVEAFLKSGANMNELIKTCIGVSNLKKEFKKISKQYIEELSKQYIEEHKDLEEEFKEWDREFIRRDAIRNQVAAIRSLERDGYSNEAAELRAKLRTEMNIQPNPTPIPRGWASFSWPNVEERFRIEELKEDQEFKKDADRELLEWNLIRNQMEWLRSLERDGFDDLAAEARADLRAQMNSIQPNPTPIPRGWASFLWPNIEEGFRGEVVEYLIYRGWTPSRWIRKYTPERRLAILKVFLKYYVGNMQVGLSSGDITGILYIAVRDDEATSDFVKFLIRQGANVNAKHEDGQTSLHMAARYSTTDIVRVLLEAGANVHARDKEGWFPLHAAVNHCRKGIIVDLIRYGANMDEVRGRNESPRQQARRLDCSWE